ncbi:O-antigen ligase family protein [Leeia oryzae]|uniref:O-antigen ligase family protein n=1 Tax=Leeia oryzae TaxID=356662 RepID=UPI00036B95B9|nr:O-antigen ligase family protein [Leeia oryzae]
MKTESIQAILLGAFGVLLVSTLWNFFSYIDPFFWIIFDGEWQLVDTLEYLTASLLMLYFVIRVKGLDAVPRSVLAGWLIYCAVLAFTNQWAVFPKISWKTWALDAVMPGAFMWFSAAMVRAGGLDKKSVYLLFACFGGAVFYLAMRHTDNLAEVLDPVMFSTLAAILMPACLMGMLGKATGDNVPLWIFLFFCSLILALQIRIIWLVIPLQIAVMLWFCHQQQIKPARRLLWWGVLIGSLLLYKYASIYKPANWTNYAAIDHTGSWWQVFFKTERYRIWSFWLEQGAKSPWVGVGMGWDVPARMYGRFKPDDLLPIFVSHGHNVFMNRYLQSGILGVIAFAGWLVLVAKQVVEHTKSQLLLTKSVALFQVLMLLMLLFRNLPDDGMRGFNMVLYWALLGVSYGWPVSDR